MFGSAAVLKSRVKTSKNHFPFYIIEGTSRTHGSVFEVSEKYRLEKESIWLSGTSEKISLGD
jgi:hypothetical protein